VGYTRAEEIHRRRTTNEVSEKQHIIINIRRPTVKQKDLVLPRLITSNKM
jgi:hypothetical protein